MSDCPCPLHRPKAVAAWRPGEYVMSPDDLTPEMIANANFVVPPGMEFHHINPMLGDSGFRPVGFINPDTGETVPMPASPGTRVIAVDCSPTVGTVTVTSPAGVKTTLPYNAPATDFRTVVTADRPKPIGGTFTVAGTVLPFDATEEDILLARRIGDAVNHPRHYNVHPSGIECLDVVRHLTFCAGNAVKYVWRAHEKNGLEDYRKAAFYLDDAIRHADRVYTRDIPRQTRARLRVVARAETDPNRSRFFRSIADIRLNDAQEAVTALTA